MVTITCPIDPRLHAHAKGHWREKAKATKEMRSLAKLLSMAKGNTPIKGKAVVEYQFFVPDNIRRDAANMIQSTKPMIDGVVDAKMITGDHWQVLRIGRVDVVLGAKLEVVLTFRADS